MRLIADSERFPAARFKPEATLVRFPDVRQRDDGAFELYDEEKKRWNKLNPIYMRALEGLRDGLTFESCIERALPDRGDLLPNQVAAALRAFWWGLHKRGHLHVPLEAEPDVFAGRYRRVKELGRGGVGIAALCIDEKTGDRVVIKHAWGYLGDPERNDASLREEAALLRRFDHPGILAVRDEFERDGLHHMVRDFGDGCELKDAVIPSGAPFRAFVHDVADALAHIHERGYLCLDLKPGNIVVTPELKPILIDLGCARPVVDGVLSLPRPIGSRGFVAPETMEQFVATVRSDVYGLGCLLHAYRARSTPAHRCTNAQRAAALEELKIEEEEKRIILALTADDPMTRPADMRAVQSLMRHA